MTPWKLALSFVAAANIASCTAATDDPPRHGSGGSGSSATTSSTGGAGGSGQATAATGTGTSTSSATGSGGVSGTGGSGGTSVTAGSGGGATGSGGSGGGIGSGGSGGSAAVPDAGGAKDAASDGQEGGPAGACAPDVLCFDFEKDTVGAKPGAPWTGQGTIDGTKSVSGKNSLHVVSGGDNAFAMMKPATFFPPAGNEYYGRVMFWVDNVPNSHWTFVRSKGAVPGQSYSAEYTYGGSSKAYIANYDTQGVSSDCWKDGGSLTVGKWVCMEWHFKGATNELELWIDDVADKAHVVGKGDGCIAHGTNDVWVAPTFSALELGFASYPTVTNFNVWYDDLALSKTRVGCPK